MKREDSAAAVSDSNEFGHDGEGQSLRGFAVHVDVREKAGASVSPDLPEVVYRTEDGFILRAWDSAASPGIQDDAFVAQRLQLLFEELNPNAPPRPRGRVRS